MIQEVPDVKWTHFVSSSGPRTFPNSAVIHYQVNVELAKLFGTIHCEAIIGNDGIIENQSSKIANALEPPKLPCVEYSRSILIETLQNAKISSIFARNTNVIWYVIHSLTSHFSESISLRHPKIRFRCVLQTFFSKYMLKKE